MLEQIEEKKYKEVYGDKIVKFPYEFIPDIPNDLWYIGNIFDVAVFDFSQMKFIEIHYPWRKKNGDIVYKVINLEEYEKNND